MTADPAVEDRESGIAAKLGGPLHDERVAARVGLALAVCFSVCFLTGLLSHFIQHPPGWFAWPTRPVALYRITQGVHVTTGIAAVPLLLVKLWTVYPLFFQKPAVRSLVHGIERGTVLVLVGSAIFELLTGIQNIAHWYPWGFYFPTVHFAMAWVAVGSIVLHVAIKLPVIRRALSRDPDRALSRRPDDDDDEPTAGGPTRRGLLLATAAGAGVAVLATVGATIPALRKVSVLAVRSGEGPQGIPINKAATSAGVEETAVDPAWRLTVRSGDRQVDLSLADLQAMPQTTATLPIACVEGWSAEGEWTGVRVKDLVALVEGSSEADVTFRSLQRRGLYGTSVLPAVHARDDLSLVALRLAGEPLHLDHGYPARLITATRPGVLQTKWLSELEVMA